MAGEDVTSVCLLGSNVAVKWEIEPEGLAVVLPETDLGTIGYVLKLGL